MTFCSKHYLLKLSALSGFFCFESIVLIEYYSLDGYFNWKFPQKKSSPLLPESVLGCSICQRISVPPMRSTDPVNTCPALAACQHSCWALALYLVSPQVTLGPGGDFSWLPSVLLSSIPVLIENKSFQLKIHAFFSSGTFFSIVISLLFLVTLLFSFLKPCYYLQIMSLLAATELSPGSLGEMQNPRPQP